MSEVRLDAEIYNRGLTKSRAQAHRAVLNGQVRVEGKCVRKPGTRINADKKIEICGEQEKYVSRGGVKLEKALEYFNVDPKGRICLDCGASTGGFTDCLLQNGAKLVYALDSGSGQLAESIKSNPRVRNIERVNIRHTDSRMFTEKPELAVIDVSFISLTIVLPAVKDLLTADGEVICLIKPQFEAGREKVGKRGIVRDIKTHIAVLEKFKENVREMEISLMGMTYSPIRGSDGNIEYLGYLTRNGKAAKIDTKTIAKQSQTAI